MANLSILVSASGGRSGSDERVIDEYVVPGRDGMCDTNTHKSF
jgi:hypothetical protein